MFHEKEEINVVNEIKVANYLVIKHNINPREPNIIIVVLKNRRGKQKRCHGEPESSSKLTFHSLPEFHFQFSKEPHGDFQRFD